MRGTSCSLSSSPRSLDGMTLRGRSTSEKWEFEELGVCGSEPQAIAQHYTSVSSGDSKGQ
jgi:hypothetical protein